MTIAYRKSTNRFRNFKYKSLKPIKIIDHFICWKLLLLFNPLIYSLVRINFHIFANESQSANGKLYFRTD